IQKGLVEIIDWKFEHQDQSKWNGIQTLAYMDCIIRIRENDKWCAFLDTDEFLFSPITKDIRKILQDYEDYSCISVYWRCYGTSDIEKVPDHDKIVNYLTKRAIDDHPWNSFSKCIVRP